jgi:hypothetical protein
MPGGSWLRRMKNSLWIAIKITHGFIMPKKLKNHLLGFLRFTGVYFAIMYGLMEAHLVMGLVTDSDPYTMIGEVVTAVYFVALVLFCWRFYTGIYRDGDFGD